MPLRHHSRLRNESRKKVNYPRSVQEADEGHQTPDKKKLTLHANSSDD